MEKRVRVTRSGEVYQELSRLALAKETGEQMPSYPALMETMGVSQGVIDTAYGMLRDQGVVETRPKRGTYVANPYADALVLFICSTVQIMPGQGATASQSYLALREGVEEFFPGAWVEFLVIDYDPDSGVRERRVVERLQSLQNHQRLLGVVSAFFLNCRETYDWCRRHHLPLTDTGRANTAHPYTVQAITPESVWGLGLQHLREEGWDNRMLVVGSFTDRRETPKPGREDEIRREVALLDPAAECVVLHVPIGDDIVAAGAGFVKRLIRRKRLPGALMVADDNLVQGMIYGALEEGVDLPDVCPVVTLSNEGVPLRASRELTRIEFRHRGVAHEQLKTLAELLRGNQDYRPAPVPPVLIVGRSSRRRDYAEQPRKPASKPAQAEGDRT